jgi:hypothetical protein
MKKQVETQRIARCIPYPQKMCRYARPVSSESAVAVHSQFLKALDDTGASHPLIDKVKGAQLWGAGKHAEAIEFSIKSAHRWAAPFIYYQVSKFLTIKGKQDESEYYFGIAAALAKQEEERDKRRVPSPRPGKQRRPGPNR